MGELEGEDREKESGNLYEGNFPNLVKETDIQVQEAQRESQTKWTQRGPHQDTS